MLVNETFELYSSSQTIKILLCVIFVMNGQFRPQYGLEVFEDTKGVIRIRISNNTDNTMAKRKSTKGHPTIHKAYT